MAQKLSILGSTGSIGTQSLDVAEKRGYEIVALTAGSNDKLLEEQIRKWKPRYAALADEKAAARLKIAVADTNTKVLSGLEGVCECAAADEADTVLNSVVGIAGLVPTLTAIDCGKDIALANKETLVAGGQLVMSKAREKGVKILPVDSEHSAIFQCLEGMNKKQELKSIILTASGGPFFGKTRAELEGVTVEQALRHPNWEMGAKITVDSATMMNKGLELIEAVWLFDVSPDKIDIVVHRESIIHSLIEYNDNSVIAQLGVPDMRIPIQYALTYPERFESPVRKLNLWEYQNLTFYKPDYDTFRCINICRDAIARGRLYPCTANGANEMANYLFRQGKIGFLQIAEMVEKAVEEAPKCDIYTLEDVLEADRQARLFVKNNSIR
ncbi:MAG: 1-deoxy-D-xylulose-5-phosphate reductoisomerase [Clostridia bacterium]|nr:1-deoxy-D-xylulose-5-phosphate reductoisomerase [Clostridia bacterium]